MQPKAARNIFKNLDPKSIGSTSIIEDTDGGSFSHTGLGKPLSLDGSGPKPEGIPAGEWINITTYRKPTLKERLQKDPSETSTSQEMARVTETLANLGYLAVTDGEQKTNPNPNAPSLQPSGGNSIYEDGQIRTTLYFQDGNPQS